LFYLTASHSLPIQTGVHNYSIHYNEETNDLVAYAEVDRNDSFERVAGTAACGTFGSQIQLTN
jgi:L-rhamnose mutarotase